MIAGSCGVISWNGCRTLCAIFLFALRSACRLRRSAFKSFLLFGPSLPNCLSCAASWFSACASFAGWICGSRSLSLTAVAGSAAADRVKPMPENGAELAHVRLGRSGNAGLASTSAAARKAKLAATPARNIRASDAIVVLPWNTERTNRERSCLVSIIFKGDRLLCQYSTVQHKLTQACAKRLFYHLVRAGEQVSWDFKPKCLRRLEVDDQVEFRRLQDRQIGRRRALQDFAGVNAGLAVAVRDIWVVTHQAARRRKIAKLVDCGDCCCSDQRDELVAIHIEQRIATDQQSVGPFLRKCRERGFNAHFVGRFQKAKFKSQRLRRCAHVGRLIASLRSIGIRNRRESFGVGHEFAQ